MQETERVTSSGAARGSHVQLSEVQLYFNTFILSKAVSVCVQNDQEQEQEPGDGGGAAQGRKKR
jgi:hypothetical protein